MRDAKMVLSDEQSDIRAVGDWPSLWLELAAPGTLIEGNAATTAPFDLAKGMLKEVHARVRTTFTSGGAGTLQLQIQTDSTNAFGSPTAIYDSGVIVLATLVAGYRFKIQALPIGASERFIRGLWTVGTAAMTAGAVDLELITQGVQTN